MEEATLPLNSNFGSYFLAKLIAVGGMAEVYLAELKGTRGLNKQLALKVILPDYADDDQFVQMLIDEARLTIRLNHANIVQTFDLGKIGTNYFISMEYVDGADFFKLLTSLSEKRIELPIEAALWIVSQALLGLDYAHTKCDDQGIPLQLIHRDISPQNILLSRQGEVKLVDFGIAKAANLTHKTRTGIIKGKLVYMSPEQAWGERIDQRTDIFSMGIVLYEALTAGSLYLELNPVKLLELVRKAEIRPPSYKRPTVTAELDALVLKALSPLPDHRYATAREFSLTIADYLRRHGFTFGSHQLGQLVDRALDEGKGFRSTADASGSSIGLMQRDEFPQQACSVIFSAAELLGSSANMLAAQPFGEGGLPPKNGLLLLFKEGEESRPFEVGEEFIIGRAGALRLGDARVSRRHARIKRNEKKSFVIEDLNSSNGTYLNNERIMQPQELHEGDLIRVGPFEMRFIFEQSTIPAPSSYVEDIPSISAEEEFSAEVTPLGDLPSIPPRREVLPPEDPPAPPSPPPRQGSAGAALGSPPPAPGDLTLKLPKEASISLALGTEKLTLAIGEKIPLSHMLRLGNAEILSEALTLIRRQDGFWLEPLSGMEASLHNGQSIQGPVRLHDGDQMQIGPFQLEFSAAVEKSEP